MKKVLYIVFAMSLMLISCSKDKSEELVYGPTYDPYEGVGNMYAGEGAAELGFYCIDKGATGQSPWFEYYPQVKTLKNYSSLRFILQFDELSYVLTNKDIHPLEVDYLNTKNKFMQEAYIQYCEQPHEHGLNWPMFFTGYVNGDVAISCDKTLFGQQPGTNLSKFFKISSGLTCLPLGRENPEMLYTFGDSLPQRMSDFLQKDTWLGQHYWLEFLEEPNERPDEITFTLSFPVTIERVREYLSSISKGNNAELQTSDVSHVKQCTVKFDWE